MTYEAKPLNEFQAWPKIPRYKPAMMHITEKRVYDVPAANDNQTPGSEVA